MITMKHLLTLFLFVCFAVTAAGQSVSELLRKAEAGDAEAQFNLGFCYGNGKGVSCDYGQAVYWYRKSAEQGPAPLANAMIPVMAKAKIRPTPCIGTGSRPSRGMHERNATSEFSLLKVRE